MRARDAILTADGQPLMSEQAVIDLRAHALDVYPHEAVGVVLGDGSYEPHQNTAPDPEQHAQLAVQTFVDLVTGGNLRAICHSHPRGPDAPTEQDMIAQMECLVPFVLLTANGEATSEPFAWGDQLEPEADLVGRPFRHGVTDCYSLVRDWWRVERGVILPDYPRNWEWWRDDVRGTKNLYTSYFADAGFYEIDSSRVLPGDCFLAAVRSEVPNHAGVFLDAGLCLHHPSTGLAYDPTRLSRREPMARWLPWVTHWLRR